jgi:hypothetical protein
MAVLSGRLTLNLRDARISRKGALGASQERTPARRRSNAGVPRAFVRHPLLAHCNSAAICRRLASPRRPQAVLRRRVRVA